MSDIEFANGFYFKEPQEDAPDFVLGSLSINREDAIGFLEAQTDKWVNLAIKKSKAGKPYLSVDKWKPKTE